MPWTGRTLIESCNEFDDINTTFRVVVWFDPREDLTAVGSSQLCLKRNGKAYLVGSHREGVNITLL